MTRLMRAEDLARLEVPSQAALAPGGDRLAYVVRTHDMAADATITTLWTAEGDAPPRPLTDGPTDTAPAWSPDGTTLAFLRDNQIWLLRAGDAEPTRLTALALGAGEPRWSPGGSHIAFCAPVDAAAAADEDDAARAKRATAPVVAEGIDYQIDGVGFLRSVRMQILVVEVATGAVRQITAGRQSAVNPAWSPDSATVSYIAKRESTADLDFESAVHLVDVGDSEPRPRTVAFGGGFATTARFTPDGAGLIVTGFRGLPRGHTRLYVVGIGSGAVTELAGELDRNVMLGAPGYPGAAPTVTVDGQTVLFCMRDRGCTHLYAVPLAGGPATPVIGDEATTVSGLSVAGDTAAVTVTTAASFGEIVLLDLATGRRTVRTDHGSALGEVALYPRTPRVFTVGDGTAVEGWIIRAEQTTGRTPLLVDIHGGPHNAWNGAADEIHPYHQELVAAGWSVLLLNPRGSDGYGEEFYDAVFGGWGRADAADFLDPIDTLVAEGLADPNRLAVTGYSYGGYMTGYLTSRDNRFAAAVAGGMLSDLVSAGGTSDSSHVLSVLELGVTPWDNPAALADLSPITRVEQVATPTLVLHGAADLCCPVGQAQQWYYALRARGIETDLVLYPDAGHLFVLNGHPSHRVDFSRRVVSWVERFAGASAGGAAMSGIEQELAAVFESAGAEGFVYAREIGVAGGPEVCVNADDRVILASVFKIVVAVAYARAVDAGSLDPRERTIITARHRTGGVGTAGCADDVEMSWQDIALNMMVMSDNAATDVLYHRLGQPAIDAVLADLGLAHTQLIGCCEDLFASIFQDLEATGTDVDAILAAATDEQIRNLAVLDPPRTSSSTPREIGSLLEAIWTDTAASPRACRTVRDIMARQIWPHRLSSGFQADVGVAAKTGTLPSIRNECGVVTYPDGRQFVVAVFTRAHSLTGRQPLVDASIGTAARTAVERLRGVHAAPQSQHPISSEETR